MNNLIIAKNYEQEKANRKKIIALIVIAVLLLVIIFLVSFFIFTGGFGGSGKDGTVAEAGKNGGRRGNIIKLINRYYNQEEYDRALKLVEDLLIENGDDEEAIRKSATTFKAYVDKAKGPAPSFTPEGEGASKNKDAGYKNMLAGMKGEE